MGIRSTVTGQRRRPPKEAGMSHGLLPSLSLSHRRRTGATNPTIKGPNWIAFFFALLLGSATLWGGLFAVTAKMPLEEIEVGMRGTGVTVFEGTTREEFTADILGVLTNVMGPRRNLIVARLSGGPLGQTGVIQGMSGSPVYIDDRLIGAVSYSLGSFSKEAIAGITPIEEMAATDEARLALATTQPVAMHFAQTTADLHAFARQTFSQLPAFAGQLTDVTTNGFTATNGPRLATLLRPIATPVVMNGFVPELQEFWVQTFAHSNFSTTFGGIAGMNQDITTPMEPLAPGDPIGAALMRGDINMAGTGTVTLVEDDRVYAFGHPFYNLGPARFPMTRASVTTILPSLAISSRIASIGQTIGIIDQDRSTGIYGSIGDQPEMVPVNIRLRNSDQSLTETFSFEVIDDQLFTPLLVFTGALNTFLSWAREVGAATYDVESTTHFQDQRSVTTRNLFTGQSAGISAALATSVPASALLSNAFEKVSVQGVDIDIVSSESARTSTIVRTWLTENTPESGDTVELNVELQTPDRGTKIESIEIDLPSHVSGAATIVIMDSPTLMQRESQNGLGIGSARSVDELLQALNKTPQSDHLYIELRTSTPSAVLRGNELELLPPSVLSVLNADTESGNIVNLNQTTIGKWSLATDSVVSGSRILSVSIEPND